MTRIDSDALQRTRTAATPDAPRSGGSFATFLTGVGSLALDQSNVLAAGHGQAIATAQDRLGATSQADHENPEDEAAASDADRDEDGDELSPPTAQVDSVGEHIQRSIKVDAASVAEKELKTADASQAAAPENAAAEHAGVVAAGQNRPVDAGASLKHSETDAGRGQDAPGEVVTRAMQTGTAHAGNSQQDTGGKEHATQQPHTGPSAATGPGAGTPTATAQASPSGVTAPVASRSVVAATGTTRPGPAAPEIAGVQGGARQVSKEAALQRLTAQAPVLRGEVERQSFVAQAARGMAQALRGGEGTLTIRLAPENLGNLRVDVSMGESGVMARLEASSESARRLLQDSQPMLRAALEARGLSIDRIEVTHVAPPEHASGDAGQNAGSEGMGDRGAEAHANSDGAGQGGASAEAFAGAGVPEAPPGVDVGTRPLEVRYGADGGVWRVRVDAVA